MRSWLIFPLGLLAAISTVAQAGPTYAPVTAMPLDRVAESYAIYQQVLPSDAIEWSDTRRTRWLLQDTTTATPLGTGCDAGASMGGLRDAVRPPADRKAEWNEVLSDYEAHCHERYRIEAGRLHEAVPVQLMDEAAQRRYWQGVSGFMPKPPNIMQAPATPDEFKGAAGMHQFSAVYFNRAHTLVAVYFGMGCGSLCGNWTWVVLEKTAAGWQRLHWVTTVTFS